MVAEDAGAKEKTAAEVEKLRAEVESIRRRPDFVWTNWIPIVGGLAALLTAIGGSWTQWQLTDMKVAEEKNKAALVVIDAERKALEADRKTLEADRKIFGAEKRVLELEANAAEAQKKLEGQEARAAETDKRLEVATAELKKKQAELELAARATQDSAAKQALTIAATDAGTIASDLRRAGTLVYLQFRGGIARSTMMELQSQLRAKGFDVPSIIRTSAPFSSEVRYFSSEDERDAKEIAETTKNYFNNKCPPPRDIPAVLSRSSKPSRQIEVWVNLNCNE